MPITSEARNGKTTERNIIYWVSKAWTTHELQLPVFYRESLARLLALEKFRNQIAKALLPWTGVLSEDESDAFGCSATVVSLVDVGAGGGTAVPTAFSLAVETT